MQPAECWLVGVRTPPKQEVARSRARTRAPGARRHCGKHPAPPSFRRAGLWILMTRSPPHYSNGRGTTADPLANSSSAFVARWFVESTHSPIRRRARGQRHLEVGSFLNQKHTYG